MYSLSRDQTMEIIRNWDKGLCRKMFITAIFIMAANQSNLHLNIKEHLTKLFCVHRMNN